MFSVALIGPDGSGKTTVAERLRESLPLPTKYVYMGVNHEAGNHLLPKTRFMQTWWRVMGKQRNAGGPREKNGAAVVPERGMITRTLKTVKSSLSVLNRFAEEWYRQGIAWYYMRKHCVVIFDRHFFPDYYAYDIDKHTKRTTLQRLHGYMLNHFYPRPDLLVYLDAPAEILFQRKGEGTLELLEQRRNDYLEMRVMVKHLEIVDASRRLEEVVQDVSQRITNFYQQRNCKS